MGACTFTVYTDKTSDYQSFKYDQTVSITEARTKPVYVIAPISTQSSANLPLSILGPYLMGPSGLVTPVSLTPNVCFGVGFYINVISGGTCTLNYSTPGTANYLPSDKYTLSFQISRSSQTVSFSLPSTAEVASQPLALSAAASSGLPVTFASRTPTVCSVSGNSLNLLRPGACQVTASQNGTTTIGPASTDQSILVAVAASKAAKKLLCLEGERSKTVTGKVCPPGYKAKK